MEVAALLFMNQKFNNSDTVCKNRFVLRYLMRDLVRQRQNATGGYVQLRDNAKAQTDQACETFRLWRDDLGPEHVLLDKYGVVVGVVGWELTYFAPETCLVNTPSWLPVEDINEDVDENADSGISDQEKLPNDSEDVGWGQVDENIQEQWNEQVRIYLRALEKAEKKLQGNQQVGPLGNHLCSGPSKYQAAAAHIEQKLPLSQSMRHRWYEDRKEFWLIFALAQTSLLNRLFFWEYIDEPLWGENAVGRHEGRLELLKVPSRMLMDWFVHCREKVKQEWDPKVLLDQVLAQMDGKHTALVV